MIMEPVKNVTLLVKTVPDQLLMILFLVLPVMDLLIVDIVTQKEPSLLYQKKNVNKN